jgi:hypothetical protein
MDTELELQSIDDVTHDTYELTFVRPEDYTFEPGQATEMTLLVDGYRDEGRPFTFTSQPEDPTLQFTIKTYPEHDGVTERIAELEAGRLVRITEPFGAIQDQGPGVFIAGGAGITPFLAILRRRAQDDDLQDCTLLFSNKTEDDIICREELEAMDDLALHLTVTDEDESPLARGQIDADFLTDRIDDFTGQAFYVCGPPPMVEALSETLLDLGVPEEHLVTEDAG